MENIIVYKICDSSRLRRFAIPAFGTISSLLEQGSATLGKTITTIITEPDGCQITTDLVLSVFKDKLLMLLEADEVWAPVENLHPSSNGAGAQSNGTAADDTSSMHNFLHSSHGDQPTALDVNASLFLQQLHAAPVSAVPSSSKIPFPQLTSPHGITVSILDHETESQDGNNNLFLEDNNGTQSISNDVVYEELIEETDEHENCSPNSAEKRPSEGVVLLMRPKKHASSELKFQSFQVNWHKISDNILSRLQGLQNFRNDNPTQCVPRSLLLSKTDLSGLANSVLDQLRTIDTRIRADILEGVAKQVLHKFPCLSFVDDDGFGSGTGYVSLKHKMINRNSYLNRFKEPYVPKVHTTEMRRNRNLRAGTIKEYWEKSSKECTKEVISKLSRDEPGLLSNEFLQASQSYVRYRLDEDIPLKDILGNLPVLRQKSMLNYHFECATGVPAGSLEQYFNAKRSKIIDFSKTSRKISHLDTTATDYDIFKFLSTLLGDNIDNVIVQKEIGTKIDGITMDCCGPVLVAIDCGNNKRMHYVFAEQARLSEGTENVVDAIADLLCIHYVHNFMYMKEISKFLEFVQEYFYKILPATGSKSNATRRGQQQRVVKRVIEAIANHSPKQ